LVAMEAFYAHLLRVLKSLMTDRFISGFCFGMKFETWWRVVINNMNKNRIKGKLILVGASIATVMTMGVSAQVFDQGLSPASNTYRAYRDASLARDSGINQPLNLLNDFYPAISVTISQHDNARRRPDIQEKDLKMVAMPNIAYRTDLGRHRFYAAYSGTYTFHKDLSQEDAESNMLNAELGLDLTRRWDVDLFGSVGESFSERGTSGGREFNQFVGNGFDSGPERVESLRYGADLVFGRKIGVLQAVLGYEYTQSKFDSDDIFNGGDSSDRDRESESIHFDLNWQFASRTSVFGRIQRTEIDYGLGTPNLDSHQTDYLLGLRFKPSSNLSGIASAGRSVRDFDDSTRASYDGSTYYLNLSYSFNPLSVVGLSASRFIEEPGDENSSFYESELIGASLSHSLTSKVVFGAYAKLVEDDYDIGREDQFIDWGLGLDYVWRNWLKAGIYYGEIDRDSSLENIDYDDSYFGIRLSSDLRSLLHGRGKRIEPSSFDSFDYSQRTEPNQ
jgi:hypothetical protein